MDEPELSQLVIGLSYESLSVDARETLDKVSLLRGYQSLNGHLGPFSIASADDTLTLSRTCIAELRNSGWIREGLSPDTVSISRSLREYASVRAQVDIDVPSVHAAIATESISKIENLSVADAIEVHRHAIDSGDHNLALKTSRFFINDLRRLAYDLSSKQSRYRDAASVYEEIVDCDPTDAYAHEYLAYNLDKASSEGEAPRDPSDEILKHYSEAARLEPRNPLFVGRWLACRVRRGENVTTELKRRIRAFNGTHGLTAVSYLARTPLRCMNRPQRDEVAREWRSLLERDAELRSILVSDS